MGMLVLYPTDDDLRGGCFTVEVLYGRGVGWLVTHQRTLGGALNLLRVAYTHDAGLVEDARVLAGGSRPRAPEFEEGPWTAD